MLRMVHVSHISLLKHLSNPLVSSLANPLVASSLAASCPALLRPSAPPTLSSVRTHLGYIPFEGRIGRKLSNKELFLHELKKANIQPVKKVTYSFDPIRSDYQSIRNFMFFWNKPKVLETNIKLLVKTEILDNRREPVISFELNDGRTLEVRTSALTELEIARVVNHYLLPLVKEEEAAVETKASKQGKKGRK